MLFNAVHFQGVSNVALMRDNIMSMIALFAILVLGGYCVIAMYARVSESVPNVEGVERVSLERCVRNITSSVNTAGTKTNCQVCVPFLTRSIGAVVVAFDASLNK